MWLTDTLTSNLGELMPGSVFLAHSPRLRMHAACGFVVSVVIT